MSNSCGMRVAGGDALVEGGRGPELVALTARHWLPLSGISDYTSISNGNHLLAARRPVRPISPRRAGRRVEPSPPPNAGRPRGSAPARPDPTRPGRSATG